MNAADSSNFTSRETVPLLSADTLAPGSALDDLKRSLRRHRLWRYLSWRELACQYDRTRLGVLWIPLNVLLHVLILGFIFSRLFPGDRYMPHFAVGFAVWTAMARAAGEASSLWITAEKYLRHLSVPLHLFVIKLVIKSGIVLALTLPLGMAVGLFTGARPGWSLPLVLPGVLVLLVNIAWMAVLYSIACLRFRDLAKFTPNLIFLGYLGTPIMWQPERLGDHQWIAHINPIYHLIELVRAPLTVGPPEPISWVIASAMALIGCIIAFFVFAALRRRIVLWL